MAEAKDEYTTLSGPARVESRVQASRFIANAVPVSGKTEVDAFLSEVRKEHFAATHHSFAFRLGPDGLLSRANDDGEPAGSAGRPILTSIEKAGRPALRAGAPRAGGGPPPGPGGVVRAYGGAADAVLAGAPRVTRYALEAVEVSFPHALIGQVMHLVRTSGARIAGTRYDEEVHMRLDIRASRAQELRRALIEQTSGRAVIIDRPP